MTTELLDAAAAADIIESLRSGIPPRRFVSAYAVGGQPFLREVHQRLLESTATRGRIRFLCGHWGAGKTHMLRLLREEAFAANYLVASVELTVDQTPFHKFEQVFAAIVRTIASPAMFQAGDLRRAAPFGEVLCQAIAPAMGEDNAAALAERIRAAQAALAADPGIDIDVRRVVSAYWETYLPNRGDSLAAADERERLGQWFTGEGDGGAGRALAGAQKGVGRANARLMLQSLCRLARHLGYRGLAILLDEAEMAYSVMRKVNLKQAHNNLLHLINTIDESDGAFLVYAATPDFFVDDRYGIVNYGALAQRIGRPELAPPRALDRVWNLDALRTAPEDYQIAAAKIRTIYALADPAATIRLPSDTALRAHIAELVEQHPEFSYISTWRVVVTGAVRALDRAAEGAPAQPPPEAYRDVMARLREP